MGEAIHLCCIAAPEDRAALETLDKHLQPFPAVQLWHEGLLPVGTNRRAEVERAVAAASLVLCLVSPDLLATPECMDVILWALEAGVHVRPLLYRPAAWEQTLLRVSWPLPADRRFLTDRPPQAQDRAWLELARAIARAAAPPKPKRVHPLDLLAQELARHVLKAAPVGHITLHSGELIRLR